MKSIYSEQRTPSQTDLDKFVHHSLFHLQCSSSSTTSRVYKQVACSFHSVVVLWLLVGLAFLMFSFNTMTMFLALSSSSHLTLPSSNFKLHQEPSSSSAILSKIMFSNSKLHRPRKSESGANPDISGSTVSSDSVFTKSSHHLLSNQPSGDSNSSSQHALLHHSPPLANWNSEQDDDAVDAVFTYVNPADPLWLSQFIAFTDAARINRSTIDNRYRDWGELRYSMRSVYMYAPWVRTLWLVVAHESQVPPWINQTNPRIRIVFHRDILPRSVLPTFNSLVIESALHRIPGLASQYLYLNNDVLFNRPADMNTLFGSKRVYHQYLDWELPVVYLDAPEHCQTYIDGKKMDFAFPSFDILTACSNFIDFFLTRVLSIALFKQPPTHWFTHTPHFYQRSLMYQLESKIATYLSSSRQNRIRMPLTDVSIHILYEAMMNSLSTIIPTSSNSSSTSVSSSSSAPVMIVKKLSVTDLNTLYQSQQQSTFYSYVLFGPNEVPSRCHRVQTDCRWYWNLLQVLKSKGQFVGIEDDMGESIITTSSSSSIQSGPASVHLHRCRLQTMMQLSWPSRAPWELQFPSRSRISSSLSSSSLSSPSYDDSRVQHLLQQMNSNSISRMYNEQFLDDLFARNCK